MNMLDDRQNIVDIENGGRTSMMMDKSNSSVRDLPSTSTSSNLLPWVISPSIAANPGDLSYTIFLQFLNKNNNKEYREYTKNQVYAPVFYVFIILVFGVIFSRFNIRGAFNYGPLFVATSAIIYFTWILFVTYLLAKHFEMLTRRKLWKPIHDKLNWIIDNVFFDEAESVLALISTVDFSLILISRVLVGVCSEHDSHIYASIYCNPQAASDCPPIDSVMILFLGFYLVQVFIKSVRKRVLIVCWLISFITVLWSLFYLQGWVNLWALLYGLFIFLLSYEFERVQMSVFLQEKCAIQKEKSKRESMELDHYERQLILTQLNELKLLEEKKRFELEIENDAKLMEMEANQLRSLMGNVAHDLKTPIHSIVMDIEMLKTKYLKLVSMHESLSKDSDGTVASNNNQLMALTNDDNDESHPIALFESLEATCSFMTMCINRCLDYMKASSNIALTASMETFNIKSALSIPVRCIKHHLQASDQSRIIVNDFTENICSYIISDKHWFSENVLCLLSNAIKYSDRNTPVELKISLVSEDLLNNDVAYNRQVEEETNKQIEMALIMDENNTSTNNEITALENLQSRLNSSSKYIPLIQSIVQECSSSKQESSFMSRSNHGSLEASLKAITEDGNNANSLLAVMKGPKLKPKPLSISRNNNSVAPFSSPEITDAEINKSSTGTLILTSSASSEKVNTVAVLSKSVTPIKPRMMIRVAIEDRGVGISEEARRKLFQPFKQAQRMAGGTGLGLYSLYKRMEAMTGLCGVETRPDGLSGSVFWFAFPYRPDHIYAETEEEYETCEITPRPAEIIKTKRQLSFESDVSGGSGNTSKSPIGPLINPINIDQGKFPSGLKSPNNEIPPIVHSNSSKSKSSVSSVQIKGLRILLVDDSSSILKITSRALRAKGHTVQTEENGSRGLDRMKKALLTNEFDIVLTDLQMPVMDGFEFVRRFRSFENESKETIQSAVGLEEVPVTELSGNLPKRKLNNRKGNFVILGMSANSDDASKQEAYNAGMDSFICKPFTYQDFVQVLRVYMHTCDQY